MDSEYTPNQNGSTEPNYAPEPTMTDHVDVLIVGAGLSGIGAACHLEERCPTKSYLLLEGRSSMGGTWDLFRYPGIRSDSDMFTLGYSFKPWTEAKDIADGPSILNYVKETAAEYGVDAHIRYGHMVKKATWSTNDATWTVEATRKETGESVHITCNMLLMCAGYYSYKGGYEVDFEGRDAFQGQIIHPQKWPDDLDYSGKKVVVIGSGATAVTIVPAMTDNAEHITMLQRSPTYMVSRPSSDPVAAMLRKRLSPRWAYRLIRLRNTAMQGFYYGRMRARPKEAAKVLINGVRDQLGEDYDIETHFTPRYDPWDQRLCLVPDGDLFEAINDGKASVVTDEIERFTEKGILLKSGQELDADIIVTATGLNMEVLGGIQFAVDGKTVHFPDTYTYKGMMYSGVPNLITTFGYINASWTLRADLTAEFTCRVINQMDERGVRQVTPRLRKEDQNMPALPWIQNFTSGYMERAMHLFPKQGDREPWINPQNYRRDKKMIRHGVLEDGALIFHNPAGTHHPPLTMPVLTQDSVAVAAFAD